MRVLDRYIVFALGRHIALSMSVLLVLVGLFLFVNEQGWITAGYGQPQALRYVLAQLPATALQFLPVAALLGSLLALGELARGSELTVMRAAGISVARIAASVALAGLLLVPLAVVVGEVLAPPLAHAAHISKTLDRNGGLSLARGAAWQREGSRLLRADGAGGLTLFELDPQGRLAALVSAPRSQGSPHGQQLLDAVAVRFGPQGTTREEHAVFDPGMQASDALFELSGVDPRQQSLLALARTASVLEGQGQDAARQRFALWSGVARLVAVPLAMLLAVPMLIGFLRSAGSGARASLGLGLGLLWFMAQRMVENGALAFSLDPALLAVLPTLVLAIAVVLLLWRTSRISAA